MKEVCPGIFVIKEKGRFGPVTPDVNIYVIAGPSGLIFDAGYGGRRTAGFVAREVEKIRALCESRGQKFRLEHVLLSHAHPDHFSGLAYLRKRLGVRIVLTRRSAAIIRSRKDYYAYYLAGKIKLPRGRIIRSALSVPERIFSFFFRRIYGTTFISDPDEVIDEESVIEINGEKWTVFHSPGHARDHISLYNRKKGVLFGGDNILGLITTWLGPPHSNIEDYMATLERIAGLKNLKIILGAHGRPVTKPRKRALEILAQRRRRTGQLLDMVRKAGDEGITTDDIIKNFYRRSARIKRGMARGWVSLTLQHLEAAGKIKQRKGARGARFYGAGRR